MVVMGMKLAAPPLWRRVLWCVSIGIGGTAERSERQIEQQEFGSFGFFEGDQGFSTELDRIAARQLLAVDGQVAANQMDVAEAFLRQRVVQLVDAVQDRC